VCSAAPDVPTDWLINPSPFKATVSENTAKHELVMQNGLARRVIQLTPNAATIDLQNMVTGEHMLRAVSPEARVTLNGVAYEIGGLQGQPVFNYVKAQWLPNLTADPNAYTFAGWTAGPIEAQFAWQKRREWMSRDLPWPPPGKHVVLRFNPPPAAQAHGASLPEIDVHYDVYDGIPLISKWVVVKNNTNKAVRLNRFVSEELRFVEAPMNTDWGPANEFPNLTVETDYAFGGDVEQAVSITPDPSYGTQVSYTLQSPCLLKCEPPKMGPDTDVAPGESFETFRAYDLLLDSTERERRTLALRRMYRTIAPWTSENPLMFHKTASDPQSVRDAIKQAGAVGFEMIIMSFGSGFNFESTDPAYIAEYKALADEARAKGIALGGYSLLASRSAGTAADNTQGEPARFSVMPCLGSQWGHDYLEHIRNFCATAGFGVFENDGSYPGDRCAATDHPYHHGLEDSQWVQWRAITDLYKWCCGHGVYINVPDLYFLSGSTKTGMGYRETNWSLPREEQVLIERQNMFDGTWNKTASMGWMMVPLSQYHGGGAAATIEPLHEHLDHYEARLADLLGYGVQACFRGPRLYDTDETKAMVKKWVTFYKAHREVLDGDIIHLRRPSGLDWDGILHVNPQGAEKGLAFFYNPLDTDIVGNIRVPLYYTGLTEVADAAVDGRKPARISLDRAATSTLPLKIPAHRWAWVVFTRPT
jgi:hypothetical protein